MTDPESTLLTFFSPADSWLEALPIGNGLNGAMCFGRPGRERLQLNDGRGWSGGPASERAGTLPGPDVARAAIAAASDAVRAGDWAGADAAVRQVQHGYPQTFLPLADVELRIVQADRHPEAVTGYRRTLDLSSAVHETRFTIHDSSVVVRSRLSHPHAVLLVSVDVDGPAIDLELSVSSPLRVLDRLATVSDQSLQLRLPSDVAPAGTSDDPVRYGSESQTAQEAAVLLHWDHDGSPAGDGAADGVRHAEVWVATATTATGWGEPLTGTAATALATARQRVDRARAAGATEVARAQERDHRELFERCRIDTGPGPGTTRSLADRMAAVHAQPGGWAQDPGVVGLLFDYGRYLLICSSREGGLPANLQGIWNSSLQPAWSSNYTLNINLPMNYWLAEPTDLPECLPPLFSFVEALARSGTKTARRLYDAPGWVAFHCSDAWAYTQPVGDGSHDPSWAFWPMAGPWLLQHLRARRRFGGGLDVAERAWPLVRGACAFQLHVLVEEADGTLGTAPSTSPENHFTAPDGVVGAVAASSTLDVALVRDLFGFLLELATDLGHTSDELVDEVSAALARLPAVPIGPDGLVQEWRDAELRPDPDHRHTAHLYLLHPFDGPVDARLAAAATRSLEGRGEESTGWALVWRMAMWARLGRGDRVADLLGLLFRDATVDRGPFAGGLFPNLFASHPPFQIDANLGFVTAVAECLLQSHAGTIDLLPALPPALTTGRVSGLVARPGVRVTLGWEDDRLTVATLQARDAGAGRHRVRWAGRETEVVLIPGQIVQLSPADFTARGR